MDKILEPILGALAIGVVGVLVAIIKSVGDVAIEYIGKKKQVVEQRLQLDKHQEEMETAKIYKGFRLFARRGTYK